MDNRIIPLGGLCLILVCLVLVPTVGAIVENIEVPASKDPLDRDSPQNIASLKFHSAYLGGSQKARMDGVISYIDTISGMAGSEKLREIRNDYLAAAASIPVVLTADQINDLRDDMSVQSRHFEEETDLQLLFINGTREGMQGKVNTSLSAFDLSLEGMTEPFWLSEVSARVLVFDRESRERNFTLRSLTELGIDVRDAREISYRIDAMRPRLEAVLENSGRYGTIFSMNSEIKSLNQEYRDRVAGYRLGMRVRSAVS